MALSNFGEQFAAKTLRKFYQTAVTPAISNSDYEGEIKKAGDRVNILSFLHDITLEDYVAGTDMSLQSIFDTEDQLVVEKRKSYNFPIDRLEDVFTYADDVNDTLVENASKVLERTVDSYVLENYQFSKAGNWIGQSLLVVGSSADTEASVATSATGGTITIATQTATTEGNDPTENPRTGNTLLAGFTSADVGRPLRLTSGASWATAWYRITAVTNTSTVTVENWDGSTAGPHAPNGDILEGLYGASGGWYRNENDQNGDGKPTTQAGWGWELQGAESTAIAASNVFEAITMLGEALDRSEIPDGDRHMVINPQFHTVLKQASELQPTGIEALYNQTIVNGRVMRVAGFDLHVAAGARVSTRAQHSTVSSGTGSDSVVVAGTAQFCVPAMHRSFITFAYKWAESRVVDAENQFAKKYQGLHLFGAKVPSLRRNSGAVLFCSIA